MARILIVSLILAAGAGLAYGDSQQDCDRQCYDDCCWQWNYHPCGYWNGWMGWGRSGCWKPPQCPDQDLDPAPDPDTDTDPDSGAPPTGQSPTSGGPVDRRTGGYSGRYAGWCGLWSLFWR